MKVLIVEDEHYSAERLSLLLKDIDPSIEVVKKLDSIKSTVAFFKDKETLVDLVFMDIELADGVCFEIFNQIELNLPVVFTTAYDQYAIQAYDLNSIHYLLKPVDKPDLKKALDKFQTLDRTMSINLREISALLTQTKTNYKANFLGKHSNRLVPKSCDSIDYFYSEERVVYMVDGSKKYLLDYTLEELSEKHLNPDVFFRVNRKYIVNINEVDVLKKCAHQRLKIILKTVQEHEIIVSRERVSDFKKWLSK